MGTEVLRPNCLIEQVRIDPTACTRRRYGNGSFNPSHFYNYPNSNSDGNVRYNRKPVQRKRVGSEQQISRRSSSADDLKTVRNSITMEKAEKVSNRIKIVDIRSPVAVKSDMYAGSGFAVSPAPSWLPLPSFSKKKQISVDDSATRDLRRLLRLDM